MPENSEKELQFAKSLTELKETAALQGNIVTNEQVKEQFASMGLKEEQLQLVYDYLKKSKIGVDEAVNPEDYYTLDDKKYLNMYLEELKALPVCSEGKKEAMLISAISGDLSVRNGLVQAFLPQVADIAKLYAGQGVLMEDLIGEGNVALAVLMDMLGSQETPKDAEEMIVQMVMDAMESLISDETGEKDAASFFANNANLVLNKARELSNSLLRKVTIAELVKETGLSEETIRQAIMITAGSIEYIDVSLNAGKEDLLGK